MKQASSTREERPTLNPSATEHESGEEPQIIEGPCCGRLWERLTEHRQFSHGEVVVAQLEPEPPLTCFCGAPAVGWVYQVMGDGQTIDGRAVCKAHQEPQT